MEHPREIKRRIRSIRSTQQITRAMKMVAAAKLRRVLDRTLALRPYAEAVTKIKDHLIEEAPELARRYYGESRPERNVGILFFTGDRGLCGAYNMNLAKEFDLFTASMPDRKFRVFTFGKKGESHVRKRNRREGAPFELWGSMDDLINRIEFPTALKITRQALGAFVEEEIDSFYVVYSTYINALAQRPNVRKLWPPTVEHREEGRFEHNYLYEPSAEALLKPILERYVSISVFQAMLESASSEYAARMTAMDNATKNAEDFIESLTLAFNKARQAAITKEILDIVGGAEAMRSAEGQ